VGRVPPSQSVAGATQNSAAPAEAVVSAAPTAIAAIESDVRRGITPDLG
jgi:hypothetical protein